MNKKKNEDIHKHFHGEDVVPSSPEDALFHVIPVPFENSVSYGTGTAEGPGAIIEASSQLELPAVNSNPSELGIYTAPSVDCTGSSEVVLKRVAATVGHTLSLGKIPVVLGGEHTLTCGVTAAFKKHVRDFGVIQFDAHADLRDQYEGSEYSHACVMRRIHEQGIPIYQLGTRSYSLEERNYRARHHIPFRDSEDIHKNGHGLELPPDFPQKVYITFDIDGLDGAIMPATGTPVPGGLSWYQAMWMLEEIMQQRSCIGYDVVEFAPIHQFHGYSFSAALLVYNIMGYLADSRGNN